MESTYDKELVSDNSKEVTSSDDSKKIDEDNPYVSIKMDDSIGSHISLDDFKPLQPEFYNTDDSDNETNLVIKKFYDYRPREEDYFTKPNQATNEKLGHACIIPFYNEEGHELQQTLNSLYDTHDYLTKNSKKWTDKPLYICLIQDGWHKASKSMKTYLKRLFPGKINGTPWWNYFKELQHEKNCGNYATLIIERKDYAATMINPQDMYRDTPRNMVITLVIKTDNRKKHNSHEWFLAKNGFAKTVNAKYLFLTDAFTLYATNCLFYLTKDLDRNIKLSGVTGRQRLMTRKQQGSNDESVFSTEFVLRMIQLFDFELANAVYNGAFSLGGLLPVIPGPCGLYRAADLLQDSVINAYFSVVNEEPSNTGLVLGNLRIAEDRILTYYAVTKTSEERYLAFNSLALFYFEAETSLEKLILQRRRWINGSVAGYIFLLFINFDDFRQWNAPLHRKIYIWFLLFFQFIIYCMVSFVPGISLKILFYGLEYFMDYYKFKNDIALYLFLGILWMIYITHVAVHHKNKFFAPIMYILVVISLLTTIVSYASLVHYYFIAASNTLEDIFSGSTSPIFYMAAAVFILPFIIAIALSGRTHSFMYMIKSVVPYMLLLPLLVGWFGAYAYARPWDLSWGNRPLGELVAAMIDIRDAMTNRFKKTSAMLIVGLIVVNAVIFSLPLAAQLYLMSLFFGIALTQMFFSLIYCAISWIFKLKMFLRYCKKKCCCCINDNIQSIAAPTPIE